MSEEVWSYLKRAKEKEKVFNLHRLSLWCHTLPPLQAALTHITPLISFLKIIFYPNLTTQVLDLHLSTVRHYRLLTWDLKRC